jgi:hypothetical protein
MLHVKGFTNRKSLHKEHTVLNLGSLRFRVSPMISRPKTEIKILSCRLGM